MATTKAKADNEGEHPSDQAAGQACCEARKGCVVRNGYVTHEGCDHIFFVGFLGAGKSTLARNLGKLYHRRYLDTDRLTERLMHKSVCEAFATVGEEGFRDAETKALRSLAQDRSLLVSTGGGIVERPINCELMHQMGTVVFLRGELQDSLRQIQHPEKRPDLGCPDQAKKCYERRMPLYAACADYTIDITNKTFEQVARCAGSLLWEKGLL